MEQISSIRVDEYDLKKSECKKLLGIKFDTELAFENHIVDIYSKASQNICGLAKVAPYMDLSKRRILVNALFNSQFNYCPLVWICCNNKYKNKQALLKMLCIIYNSHLLNSY